MPFWKNSANLYSFQTKISLTILFVSVEEYRLSATEQVPLFFGKYSPDIRGGASRSEAPVFAKQTCLQSKPVCKHGCEGMRVTEPRLAGETVDALHGLVHFIWKKYRGTTKN